MRATPSLPQLGVSDGGSITKPPYGNATPGVVSVEPNPSDDPRQAWAPPATSCGVDSSSGVADPVITNGDPIDGAALASRPGDHHKPSSVSPRGNRRARSQVQQKPRAKTFWQRCLGWIPDELDGNYSVARLHAFHEYRQTTGRLWLIFVIIATPIPMQFLVDAIFCIPLQPPKQGWSTNLGFYVQAFFGTMLATYTVQWQQPFYVTESFQLSWKMNVLLSAVLPSSAILIAWVLALLVGFPVPFSLFLPIAISLPLNFLLIKWLLAWQSRTAVQDHQHVNGQQRSRSPSALWSRMRNGPSKATVTTTEVNHATAAPNPPEELQEPQEPHAIPSELDQDQTMFTEYKKYALFGVSLLFIYPIYLVGYSELSGFSRIAYVLLLPLLKIVLTIFCRKRLDHVQDLAAASTVFTVELMSSMVSSMCMGGASTSHTTSALIMLIDIVTMGFFMARMLHKSKTMVHMLQQTNDAGERITLENMIQWSLSFAGANRKRLQADKTIPIRLRSSNGLRFSRHSGVTHWLQQIGYSSQHQALIPLSHFLHSKVSSKNKKFRADESQELQRNQMLLLREVLVFMYMIEFVVLVEYVEAAVPIMLALYYTVSYYGPNCAFNQDVRMMDATQFRNSVTNILVYGAMEWLSLGLLFWLVKRRFKMNVFHHLGFVLETHCLDIQAKLSLFFGSLVSQRYLHYGVDFTFKFEWLRRANLNNTNVPGLH